MTPPNPNRRSLVSEDKTLWISCLCGARALLHPLRKAELFLTYLEAFPTGAHNRPAAERVEDLIDQLAHETLRRTLTRRLRAARDPYMPPVEANTFFVERPQNVSA